MVNCTEYGNSSNITAMRIIFVYNSPFVLLIFLLNIFFAITAILGNTLILIALNKVSSIHLPTKLLFRCLAVTDLCVGLIVQPLFIVYILLGVILRTNWSGIFLLSKSWETLIFMLCGVSFLTAAAISVDRFLALSLGLRYRHTVTPKRVAAVIALLWLTCILLGVINIFWSVHVACSASLVLCVISLFISVFSYSKIVVSLRKRQVQVQPHFRREQANGREIPLNIARYKKSVYSIAWVQFAMVVCYLPPVVFLLMLTSPMVEFGEFGYEANFFFMLCSLTTTYLNSSLNPILYCWRIPEVKEAIKNTVKHICCPVN
ncbi:5-hydroxytryptamine receptor 1B-like [Montipora capricornis]|uniref:5-hydroxytryptamine receptor 1B-like n=1 Tax=Montipora capricornis TaxID=246305 RepID=UPI0035F1B0C3